LFNRIFESFFGAACDVGLNLEIGKHSSRLHDGLSGIEP